MSTREGSACQGSEILIPESATKREGGCTADAAAIFQHARPGISGFYLGMW